MSPITIVDETEVIEAAESEDSLETHVGIDGVATESSERESLVVTERETSLAEILGERGLEPRLAAAVVRDVARQVHILHKHGLPHGRISASHVTVADDATVDISLPADSSGDEADAEAFSDDLRALGALLRRLVTPCGEEEGSSRPTMLERIATRAENGTTAQGYRSPSRFAAALDRYLVLSEWDLVGD